MLKAIRKKIKQVISFGGGQKVFAERVDIRQALLSEFLNAKVDVKVSTLERILKGAGLDMVVDEPNKLMQRDYCVLNGESFHPGEYTNDKLMIEFCFGSTHTSKQGVVLRDEVNGKLSLIVF